MMDKMGKDDLKAFQYEIQFSPDAVQYWGNMINFNRDMAKFFSSKGIDLTFVPILNKKGSVVILIENKPEDFVAASIKKLEKDLP